MAESGHAVLTRAGDIQRVVSDFYRAFSILIRKYQEQGLYPVNGPVDIRVSGLDRAEQVALPGAVEPWLSALRPRPDQPAWDCAVWLGVLTLPGTPGAADFFTELEAWMLGHYSGAYAGLRVEWPKGWAYGAAGPWTDEAMLNRGIPGSLGQGQKVGEGWREALALLNGYDPHRLFSNAFLDRFMP